MTTKTLILIGAAVAAVLTMAKETAKSNLEIMAEAIKVFEGWAPSSRSYRNNNPGNLKFAGQPGAVSQDDQGHAIFDTYASGWTALLNQIKAAVYGTSAVYSPADTLYEFFARYAEANQIPYAAFVARQLGVEPTTRIGDLG